MTVINDCDFQKSERRFVSTRTAKEKEILRQFRAMRREEKVKEGGRKAVPAL